MSNKYLIIPSGGLGNRLRFLESIIRLAKINDSEIICYWNNNEECSIRFSDIFEPIGSKVRVIENNSILYQRPDISNFFIPFIYGVLNPFIYHYYLDYNYTWNSDIIRKTINKLLRISVPCNITKDLGKRYLICSCYNILDGPTSLSFLKLKQEFRIIVDKIIKDKNVVGIHFRGTDNVTSLEKSPIELFVTKMNELVCQNPDVKFFVSTDESRVKDDLKQKFGDRILTYNATLERDSKRGMIDAVIEMWCLSSTKYIIGSSDSSFSSIAAKIGNITKINLSK